MGVNMTEREKNPNVQENFAAGLVGAFLYALIGGIIWYVLWQIGIIAGISGAIGVICAIRGYSFFAKKESIKGIVWATVIAVLVLVIAWYFCLATDVHIAYKQWFADGEVDYMPNFFECVRSAYLFLEEPDILIAYIKDLVIGLIFCGLGLITPVRNAVRKTKDEKAMAEHRQAAEQAGENTDYYDPNDFKAETPESNDTNQNNN